MGGVTPATIGAGRAASPRSSAHRRHPRLPLPATDPGEQTAAARLTIGHQKTPALPTDARHGCLVTANRAACRLRTSMIARVETDRIALSYRSWLFGIRDIVRYSRVPPHSERYRRPSVHCTVASSGHDNACIILRRLGMRRRLGEIGGSGLGRCSSASRTARRRPARRRDHRSTAAWRVAGPIASEPAPAERCARSG